MVSRHFADRKRVRVTDDYQFLESIGAGTYGEVRLAHPAR
jgi:hypothetical protein